jgi:hypothetical protein
LSAAFEAHHLATSREMKTSATWFKCESELPFSEVIENARGMSASSATWTLVCASKGRDGEGPLSYMPPVIGTSRVMQVPGLFGMT